MWCRTLRPRDAKKSTSTRGTRCFDTCFHNSSCNVFQWFLKRACPYTEPPVFRSEYLSPFGKLPIAWLLPPCLSLCPEHELSAVAPCDVKLSLVAGHLPHEPAARRARPHPQVGHRRHPHWQRGSAPAPSEKESREMPLILGSSFGAN